MNLTPLELYLDELQVHCRLEEKSRKAAGELAPFRRGPGQVAQSEGTRPRDLQANRVQHRKEVFRCKPWWQRTRNKKLSHRAAPKANREWIAGELKAFPDRSWEKPGFHIRRSWPRASVVAAREQIAQEVAGEVARLLPLLEEINGDPNLR